MITVKGPILNGDGSVVTSVVRFAALGDLPGLAQGAAVIGSDVVVTPAADGSFATRLARGRWRTHFRTTKQTIDIDVPESSGITGQNEEVAFADLLPLEVLLGEGAGGVGYRVRGGLLELWNAEQEKFFPVYLAGAAGAEQLVVATEDRNVLLGNGNRLKPGQPAKQTVRTNLGRLELFNADQSGWQPVFARGLAGAVQLAFGEKVTGPLQALPAQTERVRGGVLEIWSGDAEGWFPFWCAGAAGAETVAFGDLDANA